MLGEPLSSCICCRLSYHLTTQKSSPLGKFRNRIFAMLVLVLAAQYPSSWFKWTYFSASRF